MLDTMDERLSYESLLARLTIILENGGWDVQTRSTWGPGTILYTIDRMLGESTQLGTVLTEGYRQLRQLAERCRSAWLEGQRAACALDRSRTYNNGQVLRMVLQACRDCDSYYLAWYTQGFVQELRRRPPREQAHRSLDAIDGLRR